MNPITLTELQKSKLLEMCKELFPEYNRKYLKKEFNKLLKYGNYKPQKPQWCIGNDDKIYLQLFYTLYEDMSYELIEIHWFEFCMTYLVNKIPNAKLFILALRGKKSAGLTNNKYKENHPVDYLYEQFLKTKNNN